MDEIKEKLEILLKSYIKAIGKDVIAVIIMSKTGDTRYALSGELNEFIEIDLIENFDELIEPMITKVKLEYEVGGYGAGSFETKNYRFIFCEAGEEIIFITALLSNAMVDVIIPYAYLAAEKIVRLIDNRPVNPVMPELNLLKRKDDADRKIGEISKIFDGDREFKCKIVMGGNENVGKTSMVHRYVEDIFHSDYKSTIGTSIMRKKCEYPNLDSVVNFQIWDLAGQEHFKSVRSTFLVNSHTGMLVYDITNRQSFENIKNWYNEITSISPNVSLILIGNKNDLPNIEVSREEGGQLAEELGISFIETSAKSGENINEAFNIMGLQLIIEAQNQLALASMSEKKREELIVEEEVTVIEVIGQGEEKELKIQNLMTELQNLRKDIFDELKDLQRGQQDIKESVDLARDKLLTEMNASEYRLSGMMAKVGDVIEKEIGSLRDLSEEKYNMILTDISTILGMEDWESLVQNITTRNVSSSSFELLRKISERTEYAIDTIEGIKQNGDAVVNILLGQLIQGNIGFAGSRESGNIILVNNMYNITITSHSKTNFEVTQLGVNVKPVDASINGHKRDFESDNQGYYNFIPKEPLIVENGRRTLAKIDIWGPEKRNQQVLNVRIDAKIELQGNSFSVQTYAGPFTIERETTRKLFKDTLIKGLKFTVMAKKALKHFL